MNTVYTISGALLMNGVLQLVIYPLLYNHMGGEQLGALLYIMGIVAVLCPSVGQALNTSRLVVGRDCHVVNGDYNILLLVFGGIGSICGLIVARGSLDSVWGGLLTIVLLMTTIFRYYGDVEYRLSLNYRQYFCYYAVLTVGYVAGYGIYMFTGCWYWIFITGEAASLAYLAITGQVFHRFFQISEFFTTAMQRGGFLILSYFITNLTLNIDRLVLKHLIGDLAVTQYYATSLIGKTMVLLVAPVNTIIISYLTKRKERMNRKQFLVFAGAGFGVSLVFFLFTQIGTPIFIRLFYSDLYESVREIITVVNLTQVLGLLSAYLFIVVLTFTREKWQLILQIFHMAVMSAFILIFRDNRGIMGFAIALLAANMIRILAVMILGLLNAKGTVSQETSGGDEGQ